MNNKRFHYLQEGKPVGPISFQELQQFVAAKQIGPKDLVWPEGAPNWIPASQVEGLFAAAPPPPPPPPPAPPPPAPAPAAPVPAPTEAKATNRDALVNAAMAGFESGFGGASKPPPRPKTDPIAVVKFILTSLPGSAGIAFIGFLFLCCGGCGMALSFTGESAPTKIAIADLESKGSSVKWLEVTDGNIFWPEMVSDILEKKKGQEVEKSTVWYYVPLVSKSVAEEWVLELAKSGKDAKFNYAKVRVFLKISPKQMKSDFPKVSDGGKDMPMLQEKSPVKGTVGSFKAIPEHVLKGVKANAKDQDADRMIVLNYGEEMASTGMGVCTAIFLWILALPWFVPLGLVLFKQFGRPKPAAPGPAPTEPAKPSGVA